MDGWCYPKFAYFWRQNLRFWPKLASGEKLLLSLFTSPSAALCFYFLFLAMERRVECMLCVVLPIYYAAALTVIDVGQDVVCQLRRWSRRSIDK
jgi:hypothetical protein